MLGINLKSAAPPNTGRGGWKWVTPCLGFSPLCLGTNNKEPLQQAPPTLTNILPSEITAAREFDISNQVFKLSTLAAEYGVLNVGGQKEGHSRGKVLQLGALHCIVQGGMGWEQWRKESKLLNCFQGKEGCLTGLEWLAEGGSLGQMTKEKLEKLAKLRRCASQVHFEKYSLE